MSQLGVVGTGSFLGGWITESLSTIGNPIQVQQFFDRLLTLPTVTQQQNYTTLINALVAGGVWSLLDWLHVYAAADAGTSLINLVQSTSQGQQVVTGGYPSFTPFFGWAGTGVNTCIDTGFNPSTFGGNYTQNSAHVAAWSLSSAAVNAGQFDICYLSGAGDVKLLPRLTGNTAAYEINGGGTDSTPASSDASGFWLNNRSSSGASALFRNGSPYDTNTTSSSAPLNQDLATVAGPNQVAAACGGGALTTGQITALYNALNVYLTAVGA